MFLRNIFLLQFCIAWLLMYFVTDHYLPWVSWHSEAVAFGAAILLIMASIFTNQKKIKQKKIEIPIENIYFCSIIILAVMQTSIGMLNFRSDLWMIVVYVGLIVFSMTASYILNKNILNDNNRKTFEFPELFATVLIVAAVICAVQAMIQALDVGEHGIWIVSNGAVRRPGGNISQPNHLATMLALGLTALLFLKDSGWLNIKSTIALYGLIVSGLAITESRTGFLSLLLIFFLYSQKNFDSKSNVPFNSICVAFYVSTFFIWPYLWGFLQVDQRTGGINTTTSGRLDIWLQMIYAIFDRPIFGWGIGQTSMAQSEVAINYLESLPITYAHNIILDFSIWFGIPLALIYLCVATGWLRGRYKLICDSRGSFYFSVLIPLAVHSLLEFPFVYSYFLVPFGIAMGGLCNGGAKAFHVGKPAWCIAISIWIMILFASVCEYVGIEEDLRIRRFAVANVGEVPTGYHPVSPIILSQLGALLDVVQLKPKKGMANADIEKARIVALKFPWPATMAKYIEILELNGFEEKADVEKRILASYYGFGIIKRINARVSEARH